VRSCTGRRHQTHQSSSPAFWAATPETCAVRYAITVAHGVLRMTFAPERVGRLLAQLGVVRSRHSLLPASCWMRRQHHLSQPGANVPDDDILVMVSFGNHRFPGEFCASRTPATRNHAAIFMHNERLMCTVRVGASDPNLVNLILKQSGGSDGELAAAMRCFTRRLAEIDPGQRLSCSTSQRKVRTGILL